MVVENTQGQEQQSIARVCGCLTRDNCNIGDEKWWQIICSEGTPVMAAMTGEYADVVFLWRESPPQKDAAATQAVYIDINGVTDHHSFNMAQLTRIAGTDVWFYVAAIPLTWRGGYAFIPVPSALVQPDYAGNYSEKRQQHRQWLQQIFPLSCRDQLNPNGLTHCPWGSAKTPLHMPDAPPQPQWQPFDKLGGKSVAKATYTIDWQSEMLNGSRRVWLYSTASSEPQVLSEQHVAAEQPLSPGQPALPVVLLLDGRFWSESLPIYDALSCATQEGVLPPAVYVLIDEVDGRRRHDDLSCNATFWQAIMQELFPVIAHYFTLSNDPQQTVVAGQSLGGLAAMFAALNWPERFGSVVCQSGSFWWPDFSIVKPPGDYVAPESLHLLSEMSRQVHDGLGRRAGLNIFMEVGSGEDIMIDLSQDMYCQLASQQHNIQYRVFEGGHERLCWRGGIIDGLSYIFSL
ncbi:Enterochelin esterase [Vibrio ruber DSM 16370]|uniref:Enterochelin esterase n=1 Tax=Vibrio ruber (strain DSM 16370 / JCM 11486 / BCRC 17186 / CECT 7878 / LMG 23124 / VR1) TaxID=1123498 RepID=A0A1R4LSH4_VIBR1|nr:enterochelin esterase [Vibrio ruber]SJN59339.1 Enterochelin esterase [Vibrio ruber DSM 16370]